MTYEEKIQEFQIFIQESFTDPETDTFYQTSAMQMLDNLRDTISQNPDSILILQNQELMVKVGKFIGREDFLKPNGEFNPMVIFDFAKDEFGFDLLGKIPAFMRNALLAQMGIK